MTARDRPDEIDVTENMVREGIAALREFHFGESEARVVAAVFLAMEIERRAN